MPVKLTKRQVADAGAIVRDWIGYRAVMNEVPGVSFGISYDGEAVLLGSWGCADLGTKRPAEPDTGYRVASITKTVTATLALQLVERGKLRLDEPITRYLAWLKPSLGRSGVTVRHLLTHSSGLIRDGSCEWGDQEFLDRDALRRDVSAQASVAEPSVGFNYSNVAYALLGEIVEELSGRSFGSAVNRGVVRPLGLVATGTRLTPRLRSSLATGYHHRRPGEPYRAAPVSEARAFEPAAGLISNVPDLLEYQQAHFPGDARLLGELSKREMQRVQWQRGEEPHHGYGWMIWGVDGITVRGHAGGYPGFVTRIGFAPDLRVAAAVLTNTIGPLAELGLNAIFHTVGRVNALWDDAGAPPHGHSRTSLGRFAGQYRNDFGEQLVVRVNQSLYLANPDDDRPMRLAARLSPLDDGTRFVICDNEDYGQRGGEISFDLGPAGQATVLHYGAQAMPCVEV
jgi:CubicO group peptidase (beta-lactamase class C family)